MSEPLVSVVTPTGRLTQRLQDTLDSVAGQTLDDWEHLIVDDGSDDATRELASSRVAEDPRFRRIGVQGRCAGDRRNIGIKAARAPFVVLLDAGAVLSRGCLERRAAVMSRNADLDFAVFEPGAPANARDDPAVGIHPQLIGDDLCRFLYSAPPWTSVAPIWRRETLLRLGLFDESLPGWQDIELYVRAICAGCRYLRFPEVDHAILQPSKPADARLESAIAAIERLEAHVRAGPGMNWVRQRALCSLYFFVAKSWVERSDLRAGLAAWDRIRTRRLGPAHLHREGAALLRLRAAGAPCGGLIHAWKGWTRLRALPEAQARGAPVGLPVGRTA